MRTKEELIKLFEDCLEDLRNDSNKYKDYIDFEWRRNDEYEEMDAAFTVLLNSGSLTDEERDLLCLSLIPKVDFHYEFEVFGDDDEVKALEDIEDEDLENTKIHAWVGDCYCCQIPATLSDILQLNYECEDCYSIPECTREKLEEFVKQIDKIILTGEL